MLLRTSDFVYTYLFRYDNSRGRHVMNEVETYLNSLWKDVEKNEEEKIARGSWSKDQAKFFDSVYSSISNYKLAKLTNQQVCIVNNCPICLFFLQCNHEKKNLKVYSLIQFYLV